ncbi:homeodomain-interacting protein kinase 2-like [Centropristis striata]|uniref:homeodomain-interacting protein kinase 2-like n=1 Tax=Centropristis striata TaxID=184440 RepID=UPI0027E03E21|nr:homeodomain-interacting protein kinase 2-like [Centropristis striata]
MTSTATAKEVNIGDLLTSRSSTYQVQSFLGQGTFGKVAKCARIGDKKTVAIKMIKNHGSNIQMAKEEVATLIKLKSLDPDKCNLVRWHQDFVSKGQICLMFEHLDKSLFDFMKGRNYQPLPLMEIRPIVQQLANALNNLKTVGVIHADLKLENVMLVNHAQEPFRVKLIDFGLACKVSAARPGAHIQTRPYRSPEIILGLPFTEAIDMWSLGCLAASLYTGTLMYPGLNEYDMMRYIVETQGQPPDNLLDLAPKTACFFKRLPDSTTGGKKYQLLVTVTSQLL